MPRSTASFIAYDVRPAKQTERRGIVEFLNCAKHAGFNVASYRYVGFGGTKFIDFQLMDRYVGFSSYRSIEHDEDIFDRCKFNKPFNSIEMYKGPLSVFLSTDNHDGNSVYWLDFEIGLNGELFSNINAIAARAKDGDVILITIKADTPGGKGTPKDILKSRLPGLKAWIERLKPGQFTDKQFPNTAGRALLEILKSAFSNRSAEGRFHPFFKVIYEDSVPMCTVGGVFCRRGSQRPGKLKRAVARSLAIMCPRGPAEFYTVPLFNFTELERILLDKSEVDNRTGYSRRLLTLGLSSDELEAYCKVSRFVPKYIESAF
ncbi:hypothetical protein RFN25_05290 [Mesorhizobium abyssinicae]|uniref:O-methyltransferase n=1 Tax=Mesorhizobium abyssinicae TaxID=1209958 RepID=UPI002A23CC3A|nr:O-methyltransferase [Mesorhizobium abyssinicae]MDX8432847.1 hypothetical protein [Mesorhizobium abyssinicae]